MKRRRIKIRLGDVFLAPFEPSKGVYNPNWSLLWEPEENEPVFLVQIVGFANVGAPHIALYDGVYNYSESLAETLDVSKLKVVALANVLNSSFTMGEFAKIGNQPIPLTTPYMTYEVYSLGVRHISPSSMGGGMVKSELGIGCLPRFGTIVSGGFMYDIARKFVLKKEVSEYDNSHLDGFCVRPEAEVWRYFSEAKNNPQWTIEQMKVQNSGD